MLGVAGHGTSCLVCSQACLPAAWGRYLSHMLYQPRSKLLNCNHSLDTAGMLHTQKRPTCVRLCVCACACGCDESHAAVLMLVYTCHAGIGRRSTPKQPNLHASRSMDVTRLPLVAIKLIHREHDDARYQVRRSLHLRSIPMHPSSPRRSCTHHASVERVRHRLAYLIPHRALRVGQGCRSHVLRQEWVRRGVVEARQHVDDPYPPEGTVIGRTLTCGTDGHAVGPRASPTCARLLWRARLPQ